MTDDVWMNNLGVLLFQLGLIGVFDDADQRVQDDVFVQLVLTVDQQALRLVFFFSYYFHNPTIYDLS